MPFVQRVVSPTFVSRSCSRTRSVTVRAGPATTTSQSSAQHHVIIPVTTTTTTTITIKETSAGNCGANFIGTGNIIATGNGISSSVVGSANGDVITNGCLSNGGVGNHHHHEPPVTVVNKTAGGSSSSTGSGTVGANGILCYSATGRSGGNAQNSSPSSPIVSGFEFESVTNITLSNALRQLASLVLIANDIFIELNKELQNVAERSKGIKQRIDVLGRKVDEFDPKLVTVPESDLETFVQIKNHFKSKLPLEKELFTANSRTTNLRELYDAAAKTPISVIREMARDLNGGDHQGGRDDELLCTPVLGMAQRKMRTRVDVEIETRLPAAVEELRKWTSTEALGDITVTPDCISRVGYNSSMNNSTFCNNNNTTSNINSSSNINTNHNTPNQPGVSTDVPDDSSNVIGQPSNRTTNEDVDLPLDHRLPSPEEQCQIIALKFPAEVISVDTSGRRFERMCLARKSMMTYPLIGEQNNLNDDVQTVKRRSRSRKPRGKRRNTIAGTDQKEIEEAANGDMTTSTTTSPNDLAKDKSSKVLRSKSSDILKKDTSPRILAASSTSNGIHDSCGSGKSSTTLTRFNSLKQWGRNRLRLINRSDDKKDKDKDNKDKVLDIDNDINVYETVVSKNKKKFAEKERKLSHERKPSYSSSEKSLSITSHSIKPSSATSGTTTITTSSTSSTAALGCLGSIASASINPVKLRESSSIRRQRRNGLGQKDEPHSSSGNWSASSESGRTSIGSEITVQPKSSASSTSLNHSNLHSGSGPPSSVISRRRFLNTSASSSVTSEGTATPDLQMHDLYYDDETSSAYSCDTEGYYTSFHVDSGLKTLKEEEPMTPLHSTSALSSNNSFGSSNNQTVLSAENEYELFGRGSTSTTTSSAGTVCTTLMAVDPDKSSIQGGPAVPERKSSLTKLNRSNSNTSTSTLERSYSSSTVGSTLERTGTIKRNGILLQKEVSAVIHHPDKKEAVMKMEQKPTTTTRIESPDSGNNTSSSPIETNSNESPTQGLRSNSEFEYSECSDLEGVDRIERIRVKTTINSSRIPSMCIITPTTSDDETAKDYTVKDRQKLELPTDTVLAPQETDLDAILYDNEAKNKDSNKVQIISVNKATGYATIQIVEPQQKQKPTSSSSTSTTQPTTNIEVRKDANFNHFRRTTLQPLNNMLGRLKGVLPNLKKSPNKEANIDMSSSMVGGDPVYDTAGEYVTIADVRNNNNTTKRTSNGIYYSNDIVKRNLATVLSGNLNQETEYVSLNELPCSIRCEGNTVLPSHSIIAQGNDEIDINTNTKSNIALDEEGIAQNEYDNIRITTTTTNTEELASALNNFNNPTSSSNKNAAKIHDDERRGARVTFDAQGKVVYNSDSLKRRKGAHTTFVPGPCVKDPTSSSSVVSETLVPNSCSVPRSPLISGGCLNRKQAIIRPVISQKSQNLIKIDSAGMASADIITNRFSNKDKVVQHSKTTSPASSSSPTHQVLQQQQQHHQLDEDYQHLSHKDGKNVAPAAAIISSTLPRRLPFGDCKSSNPAVLTSSPFQRNNQVYWTLQNKKSGQAKSSSSPVIKDDTNIVKVSGNNLDALYATPNKIKNRENLKTTPVGFSTFFSPIGKGVDPTQSNQSLNKVSPIDPRNTGSFKTSTPSKLTNDRMDIATSSSLADDLRNRLHIQESSRSANASPGSSGRSTPLRGILEQQQPRSRHSWAPENTDQSKTCSDRLGTPKTTLMDFKKLLLATSSKHTTSAKLSAVELLKLNKKDAAPPACSSPTPPALNSSMNILELSGSPKTFANRRMLRQGNFGSPSKSLAAKQRGGGWRLNTTRTDVMSTAIPEANSEEDSSGSNASVEHKPSNIFTSTPEMVSIPEKESPSVVEEKVDLKKNIFLQAEENNFMKGEVQLKTPITTGITRSQLIAARAQFLLGTNPVPSKQQPEAKFNKKPTNDIVSSEDIKNSNEIKSNVVAPSLETAL